MGIVGVYLLVVAPLLVVATAAVWVPRRGQALLLYGGPALTALAWAGVPGPVHLGFLLVYGTPYLLLLVLPLVPWRRSWARWAVPTTVLLTSGALASVAEGEAPVLFYVSYPVLLALGALVVAARGRVVGSTAKP